MPKRYEDRSWKIAFAYTTLSHPDWRRDYASAIAALRSSSDDSSIGAHVARYMIGIKENSLVTLGPPPRGLYTMEACGRAVEQTLKRVRKNRFDINTDIEVPPGDYFDVIRVLEVIGGNSVESILDLTRGCPPHIARKIHFEIWGYLKLRAERETLHLFILVPFWVGIGGLITVLIYALSSLSLYGDGIGPMLWIMGFFIFFAGSLLWEGLNILRTKKTPPPNRYSDYRVGVAGWNIFRRWRA